MAERRMLWRLISQSRKVNRLSLKATLLYTWGIPWTDRDGFLEAEGDYLKTNVVPRRMEITEEEIDALVNEIVQEKLWVLYQHSTGTRVVQYQKHDEMQKGMDQRKERDSYWANEIKNLKKIELVRYSTSTVPVQEEYSTGTVERKGKERKGKEIKTEEKPPLSVKKFLDQNPKTYEIFKKLKEKEPDVGKWLSQILKFKVPPPPEDIHLALKGILERIEKGSLEGTLFGYANGTLQKIAEERIAREREQQWEEEKGEDRRRAPEALGNILDRLK